MSRIEEIDKIVDEIGDADSLYEFAECVYEDRQRIAELEEQLKKSLESNNDLLKQIMELQSQLISERLKGEKND